MNSSEGIIQKTIDINDHIALGIKARELASEYSWYADFCRDYKFLTVNFLDNCAVVSLVTKDGKKVGPVRVAYNRLSLKNPGSAYYRFLAIMHPEIGRIYTLIRKSDILGDYRQICRTVLKGRQKIRF